MPQTDIGNPLLYMRRPKPEKRGIGIGEGVRDSL